MEKYSYLKDGEAAATQRTLAHVGKPSNLVSALDLTGLSQEDAVKAERLYAQYQDEVVKPFNKEAAAFKKANLKTWEDFAKEQGLDSAPMVKSFKATGLTPLAE